MRSGAGARGLRPVRPDVGLDDGRGAAAQPSGAGPRLRPRALELPAGSQELLVSPGPAFVADGVELDGPLAARLRTAPSAPVEVRSWSADRREVSVPRAPATRVLVVPESVNPGWEARSADGAALTPVIVNGWQQGWVLPAGEQGTITLSFPTNTAYRITLVTGLALLPLLALLAWWPGRRRAPAGGVRPWTPRAVGALAVLGAGVLLGGVAGVTVFGAALGVRLLLRHRKSLSDRMTLVAAPTGLILAGALLSRQPWRSVDGYLGHSGWVQLPALVAVGVVAASAVVLPRLSPRPGSGAGARSGE